MQTTTMLSEPVKDGIVWCFLLLAICTFGCLPSARQWVRANWFQQVAKLTIRWLLQWNIISDIASLSESTLDEWNAARHPTIIQHAKGLLLRVLWSAPAHDTANTTIALWLRLGCLAFVTAYTVRFCAAASTITQLQLLAGIGGRLSRTDTGVRLLSGYEVFALFRAESEWSTVLDLWTFVVHPILPLDLMCEQLFHRKVSAENTFEQDKETFRTIYLLASLLLPLAVLLCCRRMAGATVGEVVVLCFLTCVVVLLMVANWFRGAPYMHAFIGAWRGIERPILHSGIAGGGNMMPLTHRTLAGAVSRGLTAVASAVSTSAVPPPPPQCSLAMHRAVPPHPNPYPHGAAGRRIRHT